MNIHTAVRAEPQCARAPAAPPMRSNILIALKTRILDLQAEYDVLAIELSTVAEHAAWLEGEMQDRHDRIVDLRCAAAKVMRASEAAA